MVLGLAASALSFIWTAPANVLLHLAGHALAMGNRLTQVFVSLPGAWMRIFTPNLFELVLVYALLGLWLCAQPKASIPKSQPIRTVSAVRGAGLQAGANEKTASRLWPRPRSGLAMVLLCALAFDAIWWVHERYFDPRLRVTFLSVGQGDAAVVQFPGSAVMLIDGGSAFRDGSDMGEEVVGPFLWTRKIKRVDYLVMSHPELDHFGGFLSIARNFHPAEFWTTGTTSTDITYHELLGRLAEARTRIEIVNAALPPRQVGGVTIRCLSPQPDAAGTRNNNSMVVDLRWNRWGFLFTGDLEALGENLLLGNDLALRATVLKVPHHGSITSSSPQFVAAVHPEFAVISDGYHNRYHFPSELVVERYRQAGAAILRTDQQGAIGFEAARGRLLEWFGKNRAKKNDQADAERDIF